MVTYELRMVWK